MSKSPGAHTAKAGGYPDRAPSRRSAEAHNRTCCILNSTRREICCSMGIRIPRRAPVGGLDLLRCGADWLRAVIDEFSVIGFTRAGNFVMVLRENRARWGGRDRE